MANTAINNETLNVANSQQEIQGRSLWQDAWQRLMHNKAAVVSVIILGIISLLVVVAPLLSPYAFDEIDWELISTPPNLATGHVFGTDGVGRDLFVRTLYGGRMSLMVGIVATLVSLIIGISWGATAGYMGGRVDNIMMRIVDILYAMPFMFFVIRLMGIFWAQYFSEIYG